MLFLWEIRQLSSLIAYSYAASEENCSVGPGLCPSPPVSCPFFGHFHDLDPRHCSLRGPRQFAPQ
jgi:hypothetical protein